MTQQYIVGQFSVLLADLQPLPDEWLAAVNDLRRKVEHSPLPMLPPLAREAMALTDLVCWTELERGDACGFRRHAQAAGALRDFARSSGLLP